MLNRVLLYSANIIIAAMFLSMSASLRPTFAQAPKPTAKPTCLMKYSTLSAIMCETAPTASVVATAITEVSPSTAPKAEPTVEPKNDKSEHKEASPEAKFDPIREVKGVKSKYIYTDRVSKDKVGVYTKMREKADEKSDRKDILRPGDKIRVLKTDKKDWYFVQIFKSHDEKLEGKEGWIERWLIDDENVPEEPTPTPSPTSSPKSESDTNQSAPAGDVATSGDGEALYGMVNSYRTENGLPAFEKSERLCSIARERAPEVAGEVATGSIHSGFQARGYGYPTAVENAAGFGNIGSNFNFWINSGLHRGSILGPDLKYSCVECSNGNCVQIFSPNP